MAFKVTSFMETSPPPRHYFHGTGHLIGQYPLLGHVSLTNHIHVLHRKTVLYMYTITELT